MKVFDQGDIIRQVATFSNDAGPVDPATVEFALEIAKGAPTTYHYTGATLPAVNVVARTDQGAYEFWYDTTPAPGLYAVQAISTGAGQATTPLTFFQVMPKIA